MSFAERLASVKASVRAACERAGRARSEVELVAVSKRQPDELLHEAYAAGVRDFGENYAQELSRKQEILPDARFHMIGHLQRNKAKLVAGCARVHAVDSEKLGLALGKAREASDPLSVLVEVNLAGEASKAGVAPSEVCALLEALARIERIRPDGLMCIPPPEQGRRWFAALRELRDASEVSTGLKLPQLSMGMSADYEDAILEGATSIRVGTRLFGHRQT